MFFKKECSVSIRTGSNIRPLFCLAREAVVTENQEKSSTFVREKESYVNLERYYK